MTTNIGHLGFPFGPSGVAPKRPAPSTEMEALLKQAIHARDNTSVIDRMEKPFTPINRNGAWREMVIDLSVGTYIQTFSGSGYGIEILQEGTSAGSRVDFNFLGGGRLTNLPPGTKMPVQFDQLEISRGSRSATVGEVRILIYTSPFADLIQPVNFYGQRASTYLLGSTSAFSRLQAENAGPPTHYVHYDGQTGAWTPGLVVTGGTSGATGTIVHDVDNGTTGTLVLTDVTGTFQDNEALTDTSTGAADANGGGASLDPTAPPVTTSIINVNGYKRVTLMIDTQSAGANATSFVLTPWFFDPDNDIWLAQSTDIAPVTFNDTSPTAQRYRTHTFELSGLNLLMFLQISSLLAAGRTGLSFKAIGVE